MTLTTLHYTHTTPWSRHYYYTHYTLVTSLLLLLLSRHHHHKERHKGHKVTVTFLNIKMNITFIKDIPYNTILPFSDFALASSIAFLSVIGIGFIVDLSIIYALLLSSHVPSSASRSLAIYLSPGMMR